MRYALPLCALGGPVAGIGLSPLMGLRHKAAVDAWPAADALSVVVPR